MKREEALRIIKECKEKGFKHTFYTLNEYHTALDIAIKALEQEPKWIPVSEKLPTSDDDVLVTNGIGMYIGWIDPTDKRWRVESESEYFMENVIAWMSLPKPYEPQESEE